MNLDDMEALANEARADQLEVQVKVEREAYEAGHPIVSDAVFDAHRDELKGLRPNSPQVKQVGAAPKSEWAKVTHWSPMGSLDKVNTPAELAKWRTDLKIENEPLLVTEKLDGISIALEYVGGRLKRAATRGDGITGEDITVNVRRMQGVPATLPVKGELHVRGEIIITKSDHAKHFPDMKNTRNGASGCAKRSDGENVEHLTVITYQIAEGYEAPLRQTHLSMLAQLGFLTPNWSVTVSPEHEWEDYQKSKRAALDYDIDGLVVEIDDHAKQLALGEKDLVPYGARAFKFAAPSRETTLRKIISDTGATGRMTPVAIFDPVDLLGTTVTNASLYNWKYIRDMGLDIGARILVARANDVIPRVTELVKGTGKIANNPAQCSSCNALAEWDGEYLVCPNTAGCPAQAVGRLQRYIGELNVLEWGEAVLVRLVESGLVKTVPDLYRLTTEQIASLDRMGEKSAENLHRNLWAKNPIPLEVFLGALSIPNCGSSTFTLIMDAGYDTLDTLPYITFDQLQAIKGLGPVKSKTLSTWFQGNLELIDDALRAGVKVSERIKGGLTGSSFCFTGKTTMKRADLEELVKSRGGTVKGSVGKGLTYLVMSDPSSGSSKAQAAAKHGTKTISEVEFMKLAGV
jgi:DNA ligase (NAD+)